MLVVDDRIRIPLRELHFEAARSSGPGGQNVNKVSTKVLLRWSLDATQSLPPEVLARLRARAANRITREGVLVLQSQRFRDRGRNVADCLEKLRALVADAADIPARRRPTRVSRAGVERRLRAKHRTGERKSRRRVRIDDE
jgi:ribosome-associated protein